jgi:hypothetical protein
MELYWYILLYKFIDRFLDKRTTWIFSHEVLVLSYVPVSLYTCEKTSSSVLQSKLFNSI